MTFAADLAAILSDGLGRDATFTPRFGTAVSLRVLPRIGDFTSDMGMAQAVIPAASFTTAAAGLARPVAGSTLVVDGRTFTLLADAQRDARGLAWVMEAREKV